MQVQSLGWQDLLEVGMATTPVFSPIKSHEQRSLVGYSLWTGKESDMTEQLSTLYLPQFKNINSSSLSFPYSPTLISIHDHWKNHSLD